MKALCAIDGSAGSDAMIGLVGTLLSPTSDSVVLYYSPPEVSVGGNAQPSHAVLEQAAEALADKVFDRARSMLPAQLAQGAQTVVGRQKPRHGIPAAVKVHHPDLIAVGARGASRLGLPRLGSVSRSVVHSSDVPVLVAREGGPTGSAALQVLLCCARTQSGNVAADFLQQISIPDNAVGRVIHVGESPFGDGIPEWLEAEARAAEFEPAATEYVAAHDEQIDSWKEEMAKYCGELPVNFRSNPPVIREGHAGEQIVKFAAAENSDLIVVGAHAPGPIARMLMGSTSEYVLTHATCSVLIVPHHETP